MATMVAGRNGLIYVSGHEITYANAWEVNVTQAAVTGNYFGLSWPTTEAGVKGWTGSITAWHDQDSQYLYNAVTAGTTVSVLVYPKRSDLTTYWSGSPIFTGLRSSGDVDGMVGQTADYTGSGSLTATGFAA